MNDGVSLVLFYAITTKLVVKVVFGAVFGAVFEDLENSRRTTSATCFVVIPIHSSTFLVADYQIR